MTHPLVRDNLSLLEQISTLVKQLDIALYPTVGPHFRHVIDHYSVFLSNLSIGTIDYDLRQRDTDSETCCDHLLGRVNKIVDQIANIGIDASVPITVKCATCTVEDGKEAKSTIGRELMFLHSHAVHHLAMISVKLEFAGVKIDPTIGLAPSTQRHYATLEGNLRKAS